MKSHLLPDPLCQNAQQALQEYIECASDESSYGEAVLDFDLKRRSRYPKDASSDDGAWTALYCAIHRRWEKEYDDEYTAYRWQIAWVTAGDAARAVGESERQIQCCIIRDIFGNPFRPIALDPRWLTSTVVDIAQAIYQERAFDKMPILADALMDAGCDSEDILNHCRGDGPHVRGCWVIDLLLGKE